MDFLSHAMSMLVAYVISSPLVPVQEPMMITHWGPGVLVEREVLIPEAGSVWGYGNFQLGEEFFQEKVTQHGMIFYTATEWPSGRLTNEYKLECQVELPTLGAITLPQSVFYSGQRLKAIELDFKSYAPKDPSQIAGFVKELRAWALQLGQGEEPSDTPIPTEYGIYVQDKKGNSLTVVHLGTEFRAVFMTNDFLQ